MSIIDSHNYRVVREDRPTAVAQVYEATHAEQPGRLLLEVLSAGVIAAPAVEAFERDLAAVSLLSHPGVLEVLDLGALPDGTPVVISEYPDGMTLARWLETGRTAATGDALAVIAALGEALTAAHDCGVVHGCLRPEQVYLVKARFGSLGTAKLRGFGQRWLMPAAPEPRFEPSSSVKAPLSAPTADEINEDVRALAAIAELLLTPADLRDTNAPGLAFDTVPAAAAVIRTASAGGDDGFATPRDFAAALTAALERDGRSNGSRALVPSTVRALIRWRPARKLAVGLAAGASLSLVIAFAAGLLSEITPPGRASASSESTGTQPQAAPAAPALPIDVELVPPRRPAPPEPVVTPLAKVPPPLVITVTLPSPAVVTPARPNTAALGPTNTRPPVASPRRTVVWSDRERRLITIDDQGMPVGPPALEPPPLQ
jgi:serine/threonine protein kinase